jgi:hypothetical protein
VIVSVSGVRLRLVTAGAAASPGLLIWLVCKLWPRRAGRPHRADPIETV